MAVAWASSSASRVWPCIPVTPFGPGRFCSMRSRSAGRSEITTSKVSRLSYSVRSPPARTDRSRERSRPGGRDCRSRSFWGIDSASGSVWFSSHVLRWTPANSIRRCCSTGGVAALRTQLDIAITERSLLDQLSDADPEQATRLAALEAAGRKLTGSERLAQVMALELELTQVHQRSSVLSRREEDVLRLLAQGATNGEIADRLYVSRRTVDTHVGSILRKLQVTSRHEAVRTAQKQGIVESEDADS